MEKIAKPARPTISATGRRRNKSAAILGVFVAAATVSGASLDEANRALAENLPAIAAEQLRALLMTPPNSGEDRSATVLALARADVALDRPSAALADLNAAHLDSPAAQFWRGRAFAQLGLWGEALAADQAASADPALGEDARFASGEALQALGRAGEASSVFEKLSVHPRLAGAARLHQAGIALGEDRLSEAAALLTAPPGLSPGSPQEDNIRACLMGQLRMAEGKPSAAEVIFASAVARPERISEQTLVEDFRGWAQACIDEGQTWRAEDVLESFINRYPDVAAVPGMLGWLVSLYQQQLPPDDLADLRRWSQDVEHPARQALAALGLAAGERKSQRPGRAAEIYEHFGEAFPMHPLRAKALLELAGLRLEENDFANARTALDQARSIVDAGANQEPSLSAEIENLDARVTLAQGDAASASTKFDALSSRLGGGGQGEAAAFDGVLALSRSGDAAEFEARQNAFENQFPKSELAVEFPLELALAEAARVTVDDSTRRENAIAQLRAFVRDHPQHTRAAQARIALAELTFLRPAPDVALAWREIRPPDFQPVQNDQNASDRADYLAIWLADAPGPEQNEDNAIMLAKNFLARRAESPLAPEARMKLSEIYFRREDYSDAQTQLELLAKNSPSSPLVEQALYLAGLSASRSMSSAGLEKAVALFEAAASRNGPMKLAARLRQAELQSRLGRDHDALILYDGVLAATAADQPSANDLEARCAALAGRGETLFGEAAHDPPLYRDSAAAFDQLANTPGASLAWRRQALTQKGRALEKAGNADAALVAYYETLNVDLNPGEPPQADWTWYYRAGSDAAKLLETRADWTAAIGIYKKLAAADGPLKSEFDALLKRRRLEHFVWEE